MPSTDGLARAASLLNQYGIVGMEWWLLDQLIHGASDDTLALELERTPQFEARFPARKAALDFNRANPNAAIHVPAPAEILDYEQQVAGIMRRANMPAGFYDSYSEIQQLMIDGKSVLEVQGDVEEGFLRVTQAPAEVQAAYNDFFGAQGPAALAAHFLDKDLALPVLERQVRMAEIAGTGRRFGVDVSQDTADRLAGVGVDINGADSGFGRVNALNSLYSRTVGETADEELTAAGAGVDFAFGLDAGQARTKLVSRQERRDAAFGGVGGAAEAKDGLAGLGTAS